MYYIMSKSQIYTFKLTNNLTTINLPYAYENMKYVKIIALKFKTGSANNAVMQVKINGFNHNTFYDGTNIIRCVKTIFMPDSIDTAFEYAPIDNVADASIPEEITRSNSSKTATVEVLIDGDYKDVSSLNPLYIELRFW